MMGRGGRGGGGGRRSGPDAMGDGLARQPSIYSMTFDEFQSTLGGIGKDFGSMNMDEFLKNIWTAEESHAMADASAGLPRQGSLTLPRTLSQKTVDEVWRDLICPPEQGPPPPPAGVLHQCPQLTLREMTLEEFLVRAGVVREELAPPSAALPQRRIGNSCNSGSNNTTTSSVLFGDRSVANNASGLALGFAQASRNSRDVLTTNPIANSVVANLAMMAASGPSPYVAPLPSGNGVVEMGNPQGIRGGGLVGIGDSGMSSGLMPGAVGLGAAGVPVPAGTPANHLPSDALRKGGEDVQSALVPYVFSEGIRGRKSTAVEKVLERRQRRMIKNRESAARSRARKQAYTMELEAEVEKLKELNQELQKKQVELMEMQKNRIMYGFLDQPVTKREAGILKKRKGLGDD